jgi:hypothetical protein
MEFTAMILEKIVNPANGKTKHWSPIVAVVSTKRPPTRAKWKRNQTDTKSIGWWEGEAFQTKRWEMG